MFEVLVLGFVGFLLIGATIGQVFIALRMRRSKQTAVSRASEMFKAITGNEPTPEMLASAKATVDREVKNPSFLPIVAQSALTILYWIALFMVFA